MGPALLFSDVDGTLLDGHGRYAVGADDLARVADRIRVVLASSRTVLELSRNQRDLGISGPVVAENGAVVALPWDDRLRDAGIREVIDDRIWCVIPLGAPAARVRADVQEAARARDVRYVDQGEDDASLGRGYSVLLRPVPGAPWRSLDRLIGALRQLGYFVTSGGAWLAVTARVEKGDGAREVLSQLGRLGMRYSLVAAAGDGDNDTSLLLAADRRFVIGRDDGTWHPALRALPDVECVPTPGIAGWRDVLRQLAAMQEV
jgi:mannosyl-3-phosphoglycerate phosphatase